MCGKNKKRPCLPAGFWAIPVAMVIVIACAALAGDILSTAIPKMKEAPQCVI